MPPLDRGEIQMDNLIREPEKTGVFDAKTEISLDLLRKNAKSYADVDELKGILPERDIKMMATGAKAFLDKRKTANDYFELTDPEEAEKIERLAGLVYEYLNPDTVVGLALEDEDDDLAAAA